MSPINKFDTRPIGWPDPGQVQHHVPLAGCVYVDDGAEFIATGADIFKVVVHNADRGFPTNLTPNAGRLLVEFVTSLNGAIAESLQMFKDSGEFMGRPGMTLDPLHEAALHRAAPRLLAALLLARKELESYERAATGESYNSPQINAAIAMATAE